MSLRFIQDVINIADDIVDEVYILFADANEEKYTIRFIVQENNGFQNPEDDIEATDEVLKNIDLKELSNLLPGKYDVINWKYVPNDNIMDIEESVLHKEIPLSEIGIDIKTIPLSSLEVDNNIACLDNTKYYLKRLSFKPKELFIKEVQTLSKLNHPNIIKIEALVLNDDGMVMGMITPLANRGTLEDNKSSNLKPLWLSQIKDAIKYCNDNGIEYTDIKPSNVVIHYFSAILIDFDGGTTKDWDIKKFEEYML